MEWKEIMELKDPYEAMKKIALKTWVEKLPLEEMMKATEKYAKIHGITEEEMAYYPNGEQVVKDLKLPKRD